MNSEEYISYVKNPALLADVSISELEQILLEFPYFVGARLLLTKKMQQIQHLHLKREIKKTAVAVLDRKQLYRFLYQEKIQTEIQKSFDFSSSSMEAVSEQVTDSKEETQNELTPTPPSEFKTPVSLNTLKPETKELDALERQIINQTIEHVLADEILNALPAQEEKNSPPSKEANSDLQKFSDWLQILDHSRFQDSQAPENSDKLDQISIIDSFLEKDIKVISPSGDEKDYSPSNLARLSIVDDDEFVTETLAKIYYDQGNLSKALSAYNQLMLKNPKKKTYFAAQIEKIEKDLKTKK